MRLTCTGSKDFPQPQSVICAQVLSNNSLKPSLLRGHLEIKHDHLKKQATGFSKN